MVSGDMPSLGWANWQLETCRVWGGPMATGDIPSLAMGWAHEVRVGPWKLETRGEVTDYMSDVTCSVTSRVGFPTGSCYNYVQGRVMSRAGLQTGQSVYNTGASVSELSTTD